MKVKNFPGRKAVRRLDAKLRAEKRAATAEELQMLQQAYSVRTKKRRT